MAKKKMAPKANFRGMAAKFKRELTSALRPVAAKGEPGPDGFLPNHRYGDEGEAPREDQE